MTIPETTIHHPYLTIEEAADYLNVSVRFVRRIVADHRVTYYKVGKFLRFEQADLDEFVQAGVVHSASEDAALTDVWLRERHLA